MPGSRALKETMRTKSIAGSKTPAGKSGGTSKQYTHTGPKNTAPNYPQWQRGSKDTIKGI